MIKGNLIMALDFSAKKGDAKHGSRSFRQSDGSWKVCNYGPTYSNTYVVTEHDADGLRWLEAHEVKS